MAAYDGFETHLSSAALSPLGRATPPGRCSLKVLQGAHELQARVPWTPRKLKRVLKVVGHCSFPTTALHKLREK